MKRIKRITKWKAEDWYERNVNELDCLIGTKVKRVFKQGVCSKWVNTRVFV